MFRAILLTLSTFCALPCEGQTIDTAVRELLQQCKANYSGKCACPIGDCTGKKTAYTTPGGPDIYCTARDIPADVLDEYRAAARIVDAFKRGAVTQDSEHARAEAYINSLCTPSAKARTFGRDEPELNGAVCAYYYGGQTHARRAYVWNKTEQVVVPDCTTADAVIEIALDTANAYDSVHQALWYERVFSGTGHRPEILIIQTRPQESIYLHQVREVARGVGIRFTTLSIEQVNAWIALSE